MNDGLKNLREWLITCSELIPRIWIISQEIRQKILNISYVDWKKLGFSKGTLHYKKQNGKSDKSFTLNSHVLERVKAWENLVLGGSG